MVICKVSAIMISQDDSCSKDSAVGRGYSCEFF